jgi:Leucine-rich repeat (LRR) protein
LECSYNKLTSINLSEGLTNLGIIECWNNELTELDLSAVPNLLALHCDSNKLTSLDLTSVNLQSLNCSGNQLKTLDVSEEENLTLLKCAVNQLTELNVSGLSELITLECERNRLPFSSLATGLHVPGFTYSPQDTLFEPQSFGDNTTINYSQEALIEGTPTQFIFFKDDQPVDTNSTGLYSTTGPSMYHCKMTNALFPGLTLTTAPVTITEGSGIETELNTDIFVYPNPVEDKLHIKLSQNDLISEIGVYTIAGRCLLFHENLPSPITINLKDFKPGIYLVKLTTSISSYDIKVIKQ